jgi:hypothetical protein
MGTKGLLIFAAATALVLGSAQAGSAATATTLSLTTFADILVDDDNDHVFVTGGPGSSSVVVLNFSGQVVTTVTGEAGAAGMALDAANSLLYVALGDGDEIAVIDTDTLAEVDRISLAPAAGARSLALAGGRLWFSHDCSSTTSRFGSIATDGSDLQQYPRGGDYPSDCPILAVSPADADVLVASGIGSSPPTVYVYDASTAVPTVTISDTVSGSDDFEDMTITPDGTRLLAAAGSPYVIQALQLSDLSSVTSYPTGNYPIATAVTANGNFVAGARFGSGDTKIFVFPAGSTTPVRDYELATDPFEASLAFDAAASRLFSVAEPPSGGGIVFRVHGSPTVAPTTTTTKLTASASTVKYNGKVTLTADVNGAATGTMAIYKTPYGGSRTLVASGAVNSSGVFKRTVKATTRTTFQAEYLGTDTRAESASSGRVVKVRAKATVSLSGHYRRSGKYRLYRFGQNAHVKGTVAPNHYGYPLKFIAQRDTGRRWKSAATGTFAIGPDGSAYAVLYSLTPGVRYRTKVVFAGDADHLGNSSSWTYLKVTR